MKTTLFSFLKKLTFGALLFIFLHTESSMAQAGFVISPNTGISLSRLQYANPINTKTTTNNVLGYHGSVQMGWRFNEHFTLMSGISLVQKGTKFSEENKAYRDESAGQTYIGFLTGEEKVSYLSIPIIARAKLFKGKFGILFSAGLAYNIGRDGTAFKYIQANNGKVYAGRYEMVEFGEDIDHVYRPSQVNCLVGGGLMIPVGNKSRLILSTTIDLGLTDALNQRYKQANTIFERAYTRSTLISLGYEYAFTISDKY